MVKSQLFSTHKYSFKAYGLNQHMFTVCMLELRTGWARYGALLSAALEQDA